MNYCKIVCAIVFTVFLCVTSCFSEDNPDARQQMRESWMTRKSLRVGDVRIKFFAKNLIDTSILFSDFKDNNESHDLKIIITKLLNKVRKEYPNEEIVMYGKIVDRTEKSANSRALKGEMIAFSGMTVFSRTRTAKLAELSGAANNDYSSGYLNTYAYYNGEWVYVADYVTGNCDTGYFELMYSSYSSGKAKTMGWKIEGDTDYDYGTGWIIFYK